MKVEALDRAVSRTRTGKDYGPVVRQNTMNRTSQKYCFSVTKKKSLALLMEVTTVGSGSHTEHLNTLCRQNVKFFILKLLLHTVTTVTGFGTDTVT